jgi:hypothetical protein
MGSWLKEDDTPIWWPPKLDDLYIKDDGVPMKIAKAFGGWLSFVLVYGIVIFIYVFVGWRIF